jgi:hypothetical protein
MRPTTPRPLALALCALVCACRRDPAVSIRVAIAQVAPHRVARHPNFSRNGAQTFASFGQ